MEPGGKNVSNSTFKIKNCKQKFKNVKQASLTAFPVLLKDKDIV